MFLNNLCYFNPMINAEVGKRIKELREAKKWKQGSLAEACGWSDGQMRISNYERGSREAGLADLQTIANALETTLIYLITGDEQHKTLSAFCAVPIISWIDVIDSQSWTETARDSLIKKTEIVAMVKGYESCYGLVVNDDLMNSPNIGEPSYKQGETIIFMPNAVPKSGDAVIAHKKNWPHAMLKCYVNDGATEYLYSTKPGHPNRIDVSNDVIILGVVMGSADIKVSVKPEEREMRAA